MLPHRNRHTIKLDGQPQHVVSEKPRPQELPHTVAWGTDRNVDESLGACNRERWELEPSGGVRAHALSPCVDDRTGDRRAVVRDCALEPGASVDRGRAAPVQQERADQQRQYHRSLHILPHVSANPCGVRADQ